MEFLKVMRMEAGVYLTGDLDRSFEREYLAVRHAEERVYSDEMIRQLPIVPKQHKHYREWKMRRFLSRRLVNEPKVKEAKRILDLGCGNGWFTHHLALRTRGEVLGLDVNHTELVQAAKLFSSHNCHFAYGDIFEDEWPLEGFDLIVLLSAIQYFPSMNTLLSRLSTLLAKEGEIHIVDSPIYKTTSQTEQAIERSSSYFLKLGFPSARAYYHHHSLDTLAPFHPQILYDPGRIFSRIKRKVLGQGSLFPWIKINKQDGWISQ